MALFVWRSGILAKVHKVIFGLGETGLSCARYFDRVGVSYSVVDDNPAPPRLAALRQINADTPVSLVDPEIIYGASEIVVSPGVPLSLPVLAEARDRGVAITGDVAMFGELANAPIIAITGSNGKSTVTALVGYLASAQRSGVFVGGNIGTPCLDLLNDEATLYVLEVSSFQLELATQLPTSASVVLNLAPDHLDRYESLEDYYSVKSNVYRNCHNAILNRGISSEFPIPQSSTVSSFGVDAPPSATDFGIIEFDGERYIGLGNEKLIAIEEIPIDGMHNVLNCMAALALGSAIGLDMDAMLRDLKEFRGLEHRCELVTKIGGVAIYNDSKATNVASTEAAIRSFGLEKNIVLILGGISKSADFSPLRLLVKKFVKQVVVFGSAKEEIIDSLDGVCPSVICNSLEEVVAAAISHASDCDVVLFSPACASFDMFDDYQARGNEFKSLIAEVNS